MKLEKCTGFVSSPINSFINTPTLANGTSLLAHSPHHKAAIRERTFLKIVFGGD
jgi:hypothetical protein